MWPNHFHVWKSPVLFFFTLVLFHLLPYTSFFTLSTSIISSSLHHCHHTTTGQPNNNFKDKQPSHANLSMPPINGPCASRRRSLAPDARLSTPHYHSRPLFKCQWLVFEVNFKHFMLLCYWTTLRWSRLLRISISFLYICLLHGCSGSQRLIFIADCLLESARKTVPCPLY